MQTNRKGEFAMITIQKYVRAQSLEEAWQLNQSKLNRILGGMLWLRLGSGNVNTAIDLCDLGLNTIEETDDAFSIGAMVTLRDLECHKNLNAYTNNSVRNAVKDIVGCSSAIWPPLAAAFGAASVSPMC